jgi:hypothetical protein
MPFLSQLEQEIHTYEGWKKEILDYLLKRAVGRANAVTWKEISENCYLRDGNIPEDYITRTKFRFELLMETRNNGIFICSSEKEPKGYWIAQCMADVIDMREHYKNRIESFGKILNNLGRFVIEEFGEQPIVKPKRKEPIELKYVKERKAKIKCIREKCQFNGATNEYNCSEVDYGCSGESKALHCHDYMPLYNVVDN